MAVMAFSGARPPTFAPRRRGTRPDLIEGIISRVGPVMAKARI